MFACSLYLLLCVWSAGFEVDICEGAALDQPSVYVTEVLANSVAHSAGELLIELLL